MVGAKSDGLDSGHPNSNHASRVTFAQVWIDFLLGTQLILKPSFLKRVLLPWRMESHQGNPVCLEWHRKTHGVFRFSYLQFQVFGFDRRNKWCCLRAQNFVDARHLRFGKWAACTCAWSAMRRIWSLTSCSRWKRQVPNSERAVNREWVPRQKRVKATFGSRDDEVLPILGIRFFTNQKFMEWDTSFSGSTASVPLPGFGEFSPVDSWSLGLL